MEDVNTDLVGAELRNIIAEAGKVWKHSPNNPSVNRDLIDKWEKLIYEWKDDQTMPLIIRKMNEGRGREIIHAKGRHLIISDNTFAHWVYYNILNGKVFNLNEIKDLLKKDEIPFAMILKSSEKSEAKYKQTLGKRSINILGWKLCHIDEIGLNTRTSVDTIDIERLEEHFLKYANPKNMFLVPLEIGGIGEVKEFIDAQR